MYFVVVALALLVLVLLYQSKSRDYFTTTSSTTKDASGNPVPSIASSTINLTLSDLITLFNLSKPSQSSSSTTTPVPPVTTPSLPASTVSSVVPTPTPSSSVTGTPSEFYNQIRPSLISDVTNLLNTKLSGSPYTPPAPVPSSGASCSDSMAQGAEFANAKVNLEDNSDYIRKDSIPCYNCSL